MAIMIAAASDVRVYTIVYSNMAAVTNSLLTRWQQNKVNNLSIFSNSFRWANLALDSVEKLAFRLSFPLSL